MDSDFASERAYSARDWRIPVGPLPRGSVAAPAARATKVVSLLVILASSLGLWAVILAAIASLLPGLFH